MRVVSLSPKLTVNIAPFKFAPVPSRFEAVSVAGRDGAGLQWPF